MLEFLEQQNISLVVLDGEEVSRKTGSVKTLNVALLGAAVASGELEMSMEEMERAVSGNVKEKFREMNLKALHLGKEAYEQAKAGGQEL